MPQVIPKNQALSTLAVAVTSNVQVTLTLFAGHGAARFNTTGTYAVLLWNDPVNGPFEICTVTGGQGTDVLTVTRASEAVLGTQVAQLAWAIGTNIAAILTQSALTALLASAGISTFCGVSVWNSANQSVPDSTLTAHVFNTEYYDTNALYDPVTNNTRLIVPSGKNGYWRVSGMVEWVANATGYRYVGVRLNGTTTQDLNQISVNSAAAVTAQTFSFVWPGVLVAGNYLELMVTQTSGGALLMNNTPPSNFFAMEFIGA